MSQLISVFAAKTLGGSAHLLHEPGSGRSPTFVLFTDKDVKLHFSFERFLGNQIREAFGFIGSPIWFKVRARNKKKTEE